MGGPNLTLAPTTICGGLAGSGVPELIVEPIRQLLLELGHDETLRVTARLRPVTATNNAARALAFWLTALEDRLRPDEVGTPWANLQPLDGYFTAAHQDHLHLGHDQNRVYNGQPGSRERAVGAVVSRSRRGRGW